LLRFNRAFGGEAVAFPWETEADAVELVVEQARGLIGRVQAWFPQWNPPPFDPSLYAEFLGIPVIHAALGPDQDAIYVPPDSRSGQARETGTATIILNDEVRSMGRRNFSLAHEITHGMFDDHDGRRFFLRTRDRAAYEHDPETMLLERLCDAGAAELLMPRPFFLEAIERRGFSAGGLVTVAREFGVSLAAAAIRLVELWPRPCVALLVEGERGSGPMRVAWVVPGHRTHGALASLLGFRLRRGAEVPAASRLRLVAEEGRETEWVIGPSMERTRPGLRVSACGLGTRQPRAAMMRALVLCESRNPG